MATRHALQIRINRAPVLTLWAAVVAERLGFAREAYALYEHFRPAVPAGVRGWGAAGTLDLEAIRKLAKQVRAAERP